MKFFVLLFVVLAFANANLPESFNILYKYTADFRTGVALPRATASQFVLKADLHEHYDKEQNIGVFYFSNVFISVYNGELSMVESSKHLDYQPITEEAAAFEHPFMVEYSNTSYLFKEIFTNGEEPQWIVNIKKSVASIFQFNWQSYHDSVNSISPVTYQTEEDTIYGECQVAYTVVPEVNDWVVTKNYDPKHCTHFSQHVYSNFETSECEREVIDDDNYLTEYRRTYNIAEKKTQPGFHYFKKIETRGGVYMTPFKSSAQFKYTNVKQNVVFVNYEDKKEIKFDQKVPHKLDISYEHMDEKEILDTTLYTYKYSLNPINTEKTNLEACVNGIKTLTMEFDKTDYYNYVVKTLAHFKVEEFELCAKELHVESSNSSFQFHNTFYKMVPLIGTKASVHYILKVVKSGETSTMTAISMLQYFPFYVLVPSEHILNDVKAFIDPNYVVNSDVKNTAILAYANLIYKTFQYNPESPVLRKYVKTYYTYLKTATTYSEQLLWLQGLKNIQLGYVWELLLPLIQGEQVLSFEYDHHLREHAILSAYGLVRYHEKGFYNVLWPIIINQKALTELRVAAIKVYLHGLTTTNGITQLFMYMQTETNPQVYNFYRTTMQTISESTNHCETIISKYATYALKYLRNFGSNIKTHAFSYDHIDQEYGFGGHIHGNQIANQKTNNGKSLYVQLDAYVLHKLANLYSIYVKYEGAHNILDMFTQTQHKKDIHYEYLFSINNKIVYAKFYNNDNVKDVTPETFFVSEAKNEFLNIIDFFKLNKIVATDIGLPIVFNVKMPVISKIEIKLNEDEKPILAFGFDETLIGNYGTAVYNPFVNVWHGVMRQVQFSFNIHFLFNFARKEISIVHGGRTDSNYFYFGTNVDTIVFLSHANNYLSPSDICTNCTFYESNEGSETSIKLITIKEIGVDFNYFASECASDADISDQNSQFLGKVEMPELYLQLQTFIYVNLLSPKYHTCRQMISLTPSPSYPIDHIKIAYDFIKPTTVDGDTNIGFNPTVTFVTHDVTQSRTWESKFHLQKKQNNDVYSFDGSFTRSVKGQRNLNVCYKYKQTFDDGEYISNFEYFEGYSYEKECVHDQFYVNIYSNSEKSDAQNFVSNYSYIACETPTDFLSIRTPVSFECLKAHTSLRHTLHFVKYENTPEHYKTIYKILWNWIKATNDYEVTEKPEKVMDKNSFTVDVTHPVEHDYTVDIVISYPNIVYTFNDQNYPVFFDPIMSTHFSPNFGTSSENVYACISRVKEDILVGQFIDEVKVSELSKWVDLVHITEDGFSVAVLHYETQLSLKIEFNNSTMVVHYDADNAKFYYKMDNSMLQNMLYANTNKVKPYGVEKLEIRDTLVYLFHKYQLHVIYTGYYVKIETDNFEFKVEGKCFD